MMPEIGPDTPWPDDGLGGRFAELRDRDNRDDRLAEIAGALDRLYGQSEPPARVTDEIERAMTAQAEHSEAGIRHVEQRESWNGRHRWGVMVSPQGRAGRTGTKGTATMKLTSRRLSTLVAVAAAVVVVGLMALLLRGFGPGSGVGSNGGPAIATAQAQVFAHSGGIEVVAALSCPNAATSCDSAGAQRHVVTILTQRLSSALTDVPALTVQPLGATDIIVDVAGTHPASDILPLLDVGGFEVIDTGPTQLDVGADVSGQTCVTGCQAGQYQVMFTNTDLDSSSVQVGVDRQTGQPVILFAFRGQAQSQFARYTGSHIGQYFTAVIDNRVVESAVIQSQIDGQGEIAGVGSAQQARNLAALMKYGELPVALTIVSTQSVAVGNHRSGDSFACPTPSPFYQPCSGQSSGANPCATPTAMPTPATSATPAAPAATPGPQAKYVQNVTTAAAVDYSNYSPVNTTSYFPVNADVYVVASVRNIQQGQQHSISIQWFLDNQSLQLTASGATSKTVTQNSNVYFSLTYSTTGLGTAKVYFDRPTNDPASDTAYLAATIDFFVQQAGATPTATPAAMGYQAGNTVPMSSFYCVTPVAPPAATPGDSGSPPTPTPPPMPTPPPTPTPTPGP